MGVPGNYTSFDYTTLANGLIPSDDKICFIAQKLAGSAGATAVENVPVEIFSLADAKIKFGAKSIAYIMCDAAIKANPNKSFWVNPVDDSGSGVNSVNTLTITGSGAIVATQIMKWTIRVGNRTYSRQASTFIDLMDDATDGILAQINDDELCPWVATQGTDSATVQTLILTAKNAGTILNSPKVTFLSESTLPFVTGDATYTAALVETTPGATDPTFSLTPVENGSFTMIGVSYNDSTNLGALKTKLDTINNGVYQGSTLGFFASNGTKIAKATFITLAGTTINSEFIHGIHDENSYSYGFEMVAGVCTAASLQPRAGDPINDYPVNGLDVPDIQNRLVSYTEKLSYLDGGVTPLHVVNNQTCILQMRNTYTASSGGGIVKKLKLWETVRGLFFLRLQVNNMYALKYLNKKNNTTTAEAVVADVYDICLKLQGLDFEITQNVEANKSKITATVDTLYPERLNVVAPADIVVGLHDKYTSIRLI